MTLGWLIPTLWATAILSFLAGWAVRGSFNRSRGPIVIDLTGIQRKDAA